MTAAGVVTRSGADGLEVELAVPAGCRGCSGICAWRRLPATRRASLAPVPGLKAGDAVVLALPERTLLRAALFAHGLPWAALLAGTLLGTLVSGTDAGALVGAGGGVAAALYAGRLGRARLERATLSSLRVWRA